MQVKICGIHDHKINVAINNLLQSYRPYYEPLQETKEYVIHTIRWSNRIEVILREDEQLFSYRRNLQESYLKPFDLLKYTVLKALFDRLSDWTNIRLPWGLLNGIRPTKLVHQLRMNNSVKDVQAILSDTYCLSENKIDELIGITELHRTSFPQWDQFKQEISLYINIPYCLSRCTYCSFTAYHKDKARVTSEEYLTALFQELATMRDYIQDKGLKVTTLYIGGGTPTALNEQEFHALLTQVELLIQGQSILEYTVEAGRPDSISLTKLQLMKDFGVTRISINPQTFNQATLHRVNRHHQVDEIYTVYDLARKIGFDHINMDLIIGLPGETGADYLHSLSETIKLEPDAITVHALALKRRSSLIRDYELEQLSNDFTKAYEHGKVMLNKHDYGPYYLYRQKNIMNGLENIGYGKEGKVSLYNILMIEEHQTIIGLGCGASSKFLDYTLILNPRDLTTYVKHWQDYSDKKINKLIHLV